MKIPLHTVIRRFRNKRDENLQTGVEWTHRNQKFISSISPFHPVGYSDSKLAPLGCSPTAFLFDVFFCFVFDAIPPVLFEFTTPTTTQSEPEDRDEDEARPITVVVVVAWPAEVGGGVELTAIRALLVAVLEMVCDADLPRLTIALVFL